MERIEGVMFGGHLPDVFCIVEIHKRKKERERERVSYG